MDTITIQTAGGEAVISACDYDRVMKYTWRTWKYLFCTELNMSLHQFIIGPRPVGIPDDWVIDHSNRKPNDASQPNLRWVTQQFNNFNRAKKENTSSPFVGVTYRAQRFKWEATLAGKYLGKYRDERDAAKAVAKEAIKLWGSWASESDLLIGPDLLTLKEISEIKEEITRESEVPERKITRSLPKGVQLINGSVLFQAKYAQFQIGKYTTAEEASAAYQKYVKKMKEDKWAAHVATEIVRDDDGNAVIPLTGTHSNGHVAKCPDHLWHKLTFDNSWWFDGTYAFGYWEGKKEAMHRIIYRLCNPEWDEKLQVDHITPEHKLDNRECNLRPANKSLQAYNKCKKKGTMNTYIGVTKTKSGNWRGKMMKDGVTYSVGCAFKTQNEAARALNVKAVELYGKDARLIRIIDEPTDALA